MLVALTLLFAALGTAQASRCCQFLCSADECATSPYNCKWLESGVADELIVDGVQCRSIMWGECGDCCPACPGLGPTEIEWTCSSEAACPTEPPQPPVTEAYGPMAVEDQIIDSLDEDCTCAFTNCMEEPDYRGPDGMYMTNTISFQSIEFREDFDACCYNFRSERNKDATDCTGENNAQKRLMIDVDCPREDFEIVETEPSTDIDFSEDGELCYTGIRIDSVCDRTCDYEVCIKWNTLSAGQCPWTTSWVMTKVKGGVLAFGSLDGVPSCYVEDQVVPAVSTLDKAHKKSSQGSELVISGFNAVTHLYTQAQWAIMALVIGAMAALYVCYRRKKIVGESKSLKSVNNSTATKTAYMSTV